jgi:hypothetical protein
VLNPAFLYSVSLFTPLGPDQSRRHLSLEHHSRPSKMGGKARTNPSSWSCPARNCSAHHRCPDHLPAWWSSTGSRLRFKSASMDDSRVRSIPTLATRDFIVYNFGATNAGWQGSNGVVVAEQESVIGASASARLVADGHNVRLRVLGSSWSSEEGCASSGECDDLGRHV